MSEHLSDVDRIVAAGAGEPEAVDLSPAGIWKATTRGKDLPDRLAMYAAAIKNVRESEEAGLRPDVSRPPLDLVLSDLLLSIELLRRQIGNLTGAAHTHGGES